VQHNIDLTETKFLVSKPEASGREKQLRYHGRVTDFVSERKDRKIVASGGSSRNVQEPKR
jgi:hypothetical protein